MKQPTTVHQTLLMLQQLYNINDAESAKISSQSASKLRMQSRGTLLGC